MKEDVCKLLLFGELSCSGSTYGPPLSKDFLATQKGGEGFP